MYCNIACASNLSSLIILLSLKPSQFPGQVPIYLNSTKPPARALIVKNWCASSSVHNFKTSKHFILWNYSDMSLSFLCYAHQSKLTAILYLNFAIHLTFYGETFSYLLKIQTFWMRLYIWGTLKQDLLCIVRSICGAIFPQLSQVLLSNLTNYKWWGKVMGAAFQTNGNKSVIPPQSTTSPQATCLSTRRVIILWSSSPSH